MKKVVYILCASAFIFNAHSVLGEENNNGDLVSQSSTSLDQRQYVAMPNETKMLLRKDMLSHLSAMNEIIGYLAKNNLASAAEVAESRMGKSSMGKHRGTGMGPGRFMPLEMRKMGWGMHDAASEFSEIAKQGDLKKSYGALQKISSSCVACHYSYRIRE